MHAETASDPKLIRRYEGVVRTTASMTVERCEEEFEDICQLFRIKVWMALLSYDPAKLTNEKPDAKGRTPLDRYVFACIKNQQKDLEKKVKHAHRMTYIEGLDDGHGERFEAKFLAVSDEAMFIAAEDIAPLIPSTLDERERRIVTLLYMDFDNGEIGERLGIKRKQVATIVRGIREKLADWAPTGWQASQTAKRPVQLPTPAPPPMPIPA